MGDECKYYYYDCSYCCNYKREHEYSGSVDSDWVHRYCWGYHYEECPYYKKSNEGGCYLTSACVRAKSLPDNCTELETLRAFRDNYMNAFPEGRKEVKKYYKIAPAIVEAINKNTESQKIWERIYNELILYCVKLIDNGKNEECYIAYKTATMKLEEKYVLES